MEIDHVIQYILLLPPENKPPDYSMFQGYSRSLLQRVGWFRHVLCNFPATIDEALRPSLKNLQLRLAGIAHYRAFPLHVDQLPYLRVKPAVPFFVLIVEDDVLERANEWIESQEIPVLVVRPPDTVGEKPATTFADIQNHVWSVLHKLEATFGVSEEWTHAVKSRNPERPQFEINFGVAGHTLTLPNELLLVSAGGKFNGEKEPVCGPDENHIHRILETADEAALFRTVVPPGSIFSVSPCMPTVMVTCPAVYKHVRGIRRKKGQDLTPAYRMLRVLQKQRTYSIQFEETEDADELMRDAGSQYLLDEKTRESIALTDAVSLRAASYLTPTIRLPPAVNHVRPQLQRLIGCVNADRPSERKISKELLKFNEELESRIDGRFVARLDQPHAAIKLLSDIPLEWLPLRGLPLAFRHTVSRITATPGNASYIQLLPRDQIELPTAAFDETLVVRSFKSDDPLRLDLEKAIRAFPDFDGAPLPVRFVDVKNRQELIDAINSCRGAMLVLDCHGKHSATDDIGRLQLADEAINPWDLRDEVRCPPIVFACACETHALTGSHVTPSNGFLHCGATAVIGTGLPIHSRIAAMFTARLLFNVHAFLPKLTAEAAISVRWDFVFSLIQQMMFVTELVSVIDDELGGERDWFDSLQSRTTQRLIERDYEWYEKFVDEVSQKYQRDALVIDGIRSSRLAFPECLKYLNFGNPDLIVIRPDMMTVANRLSPSSTVPK